MDQTPGRNIRRPEPRSAQPQHNYQSQLQQQPSGSGFVEGTGIADRELTIDSHVYGTAGTVSTHSMVSASESIIAPNSTSPSSSFGEIAGKAYGRKRSRKRPKTCGVCGDRAKSFHFGGLSCDSCKAFFRRSVQNDAHVAFRCAYDSCCDINISTRKSCQFCRFKKCLSIGMEKSWVMTEEERNALNQQRLEKKQNKPSAPSSQHSETSQPSYTFQGSLNLKPSTTVAKEAVALAFQDSEYIADVEKMLDYMSYEEQLEIKSVVETYLHAYKEMPFRVSFEEGRRDTLEIIEMFTTILRRFAYFAKLIPDFADLSRGDQGNLLRAAVLEMCLLRGAACFDTETNRWPSATMETLKDCPQLRIEDMQRLVSRELFEMHITFIFHMKRLRIDEPIAMLLIMTVLFSPERMPVDNKIKINQSQEKYLMLLKKYVSWKFGSVVGCRIYPQLLTKLSDLRQLNDFHTEFHLNLDQQEVNAIKRSLMELHLNPYPNWKIVPESHPGSPEESRATSPILPAPSPFIEQGGGSMPMVTQALIQSFTDRRIPVLLDNPYATFETDVGMLRQVQQTLGSLFPTTGLSSAFAPSHLLHQYEATSDPQSTRLLQYDDLPSSDKPSSYLQPPLPEPLEHEALEILQSSRLNEYQPPALRSVPLPSHSDDVGEYHSERLQEFLHQRGQSSGLAAETVIRGHSSTATLGLLSRGSQSIIRKHTSGSSLPGTPSSVIRRAHSRSIDQHSAGADANLFRSVTCSNLSSTGWHGGEVHSSNGHRPASNESTVTSAPKNQPTHSEDDSSPKRSP